MDAIVERPVGGRWHERDEDLRASFARTASATVTG
jgi:hypothetical protein